MPSPRLHAPLCLALWLARCVLGLSLAGDTGCSLDPSNRTACRYAGDCLAGYRCEQQACVPQDQPVVDLEAQDIVWQGSQDGKTLVLYTYARSAYVLLELRGSPPGTALGQYSGTRVPLGMGTQQIELTCGFGCTLGPSLSWRCQVASAAPQLTCGSLLFQRSEPHSLR